MAEKKNNNTTPANQVLEKRVAAMEGRRKARKEQLEEEASRLQAEAEKADANDKARLQNKANRLDVRAARQDTMAKNREESMRSSSQWWNEFKDAAKQDWRDYVDRFALGRSREDAAEDNADNEQKPQNVQGTVPTPKEGVTNIVTTGNGGTPAATTQQTPLEVSKQMYQNAVEDARREKVAAYEEARKASEKGLSFYQNLAKSAMKKKEANAARQERDARSKALANALGSLANVFTSAAMAKKGNFAPIVTQHDKEPDSILRKSIEGRYKIENESEDLLTKLAAERYKHEAEIAGLDLKQKLGELDAATEAAKTVYLQEAEAAQRKEDRESRNETTLEAARIRAGASKATAEQKVEQKAEQEGDKQKKEEYKRNEASFVAATTTWKEEVVDPVTKKKKSVDKENKNLKSTMERVYAYFMENMYTPEEMNIITPLCKEVVKTMPETVANDYSLSIFEFMGSKVRELLKGNKSTQEINEIVKKAIQKAIVK